MSNAGGGDQPRLIEALSRYIYDPSQSLLNDTGPVASGAGFSNRPIVAVSMRCRNLMIRQSTGAFMENLIHLRDLVQPPASLPADFRSHLCRRFFMFQISSIHAQRSTRELHAILSIRIGVHFCWGAFSPELYLESIEAELYFLTVVDNTTCAQVTYAVHIFFGSIDHLIQESLSAPSWLKHLPSCFDPR